LKDIPVTIVQPNGAILHCFASGDEFFNYLHDDEGYTIIQNEEGYYMYAIYDGEKIVPSLFEAGKVNPAKKGLQPHVVISNEQYQARRAEWFNFEDISRIKTSKRNQGTLNNLVVFIRFADEEDITKPFSTIENIFNNQTQGFNSMINYFKTTSYGKLTIPSFFFPEPAEEQILSYQDLYQRNYYKPYHESNNPNGYENREQRIEREHSLLRRAIEYIAAMVPANLNIDYDDDESVDNVCFVVKGNVGAWADLLWPHRWSLYSEEVFIHGKRVWDYNFMLEGAPEYFNTAVLSHEMQHTLSFPDLYHYNAGFKYLTPVGDWDIMESNPNPPQQSGAYMKWKYGNWLDEPVLIQPGQYTLNSVGSGISPVSYQIPSSDPSQFFVLEFRNRTDAFENVYGSGLLIYRIDDKYTGNANFGGTDHNDDPIFDEVYIFRPGGTHITNGRITRAHFGVAGRTQFDHISDPKPFLTDGTFVYDLSISDITVDGDQVTFTYRNEVGINENKKSNTLFSIQPNPATQYFEIILPSSEVTFHKVTVQIFDVQGLLLKTMELFDEKTQIDISNFVKGFYIVKIGNEAKKLIVK
jgi:M6 family metalloprotease-like protein